MTSLSSGNITSGFVDLATFDELEKYLYGGPDATAYFVRETRKATWFTQVPVVLSRAAGNPAFNTEWSVSISRAGDYLLNTWLRVTLSPVTLKTANLNFGGLPNNDNRYRLRWTRNLMHALVEECCLTFNDLVAARFDTYHLDFWSAFTVPASKSVGYNNMIGNVDELTSGVTCEYAQRNSTTDNFTIPSTTLNLPLPFFFTRDSGVALPTAALPYNDMRINFKFRDYKQLLTLDRYEPTGYGGTALEAKDKSSSLPVQDSELVSTPTVSGCQVWGNYAIVSNDERKKMACAPRDILIEQVQTAPRQNFNPVNGSSTYDIRFSHAIKALFFAVRNITWTSDWSNYTTRTPDISATRDGVDYVDLNPVGSVDPISNTSLIYENTNRLAQMGSDFFSLIQPWFHAPTIPAITGYHMYSYSLDFYNLDPKGSTNYGKLTNVSIVPDASETAKESSAGGNAADLVGGPMKDPNTGKIYSLEPQRYEFITTCINNNVIRISGGALGKKFSVGKRGKPRTGSCYKRCDKTFIDKQCNYHLLTVC